DTQRSRETWQKNNAPKKPSGVKNNNSGFWCKGSLTIRFICCPPMARCQTGIVGHSRFTAIFRKRSSAGIFPIFIRKKILNPDCLKTLGKRPFAKGGSGGRPGGRG